MEVWELVAARASATASPATTPTATAVASTRWSRCSRPTASWRPAAVATRAATPSTRSCRRSPTVGARDDATRSRLVRPPPRSGSPAARLPFIRHFTATTQIDVLSETSARSRSYYLFLTVHGLDHWGRYLDGSAPVDGRWLITHRREITDAAFAGGWGARATAGGDLEHLTRPLPLTAGSLRHRHDRRPDRRPDRPVTTLLDAPLAELMARAAARRDAADGARITFSPKVFIPLTMLCRDRCGYCTFAKPPARLGAAFLPLDDVLTIARRGAAMGC